MAKGETIHIRLEENLRARLAKMAAADHRSLSNLIERILIRHLDPEPKASLNGSHKPTKSKAHEAAV